MYNKLKSFMPDNQKGGQQIKQMFTKEKERGKKEELVPTEC